MINELLRGAELRYGAETWNPTRLHLPVVTHPHGDSLPTAPRQDIGGRSSEDRPKKCLSGSLCVRAGETPRGS